MGSSHLWLKVLFQACPSMYSCPDGIVEVTWVALKKQLPPLSEMVSL